jgi:aldose 1-epimerase
MIAPSGEQIAIAVGDQRAVIVEVGGGLRSYSASGLDLVDGYGGDEMSSSGRGQVLIPWPNRLEGGSYEFDGKHHQLPLNEPERRNAIHGLVRWGRMERSRTGGTSGRDAACPPSTARLPVFAQN